VAVREQLSRLNGLAVSDAGGNVGWGLSYPWDAFSNGTINPRETIYSYTTAAAALAFLDAYAVLGDRDYLETAEGAADTLLSATCCWEEDGYLSVWYSDQPADKFPQFQTHNVNGLTLAVLSRIVRYRDDSAYLDARTAIAAHLIHEQGNLVGDRPRVLGAAEVSVATNWRYRQGAPRPNDLMHESFIVEGLLEAATPECRAAALKSMWSIWRTHFSDNGSVREGPYTWGSLGWGPAGGLFALSTAPELSDPAGILASTLTESIGADGIPHDAPVRHPRGTAWYALALARYAVSVSGPYEILPPRTI
jgi:hypothetical protein